MRKFDRFRGHIAAMAGQSDGAGAKVSVWSAADACDFRCLPRRSGLARCLSFHDERVVGAGGRLHLRQKRGGTALACSTVVAGRAVPKN